MVARRKQVGNRPGKKPQRFTQRDIERAQRAAPNRTIIIHRDGTLELVPVGEGAASEQTIADQVMASPAVKGER